MVLLDSFIDKRVINNTEAAFCVDFHRFCQGHFEAECCSIFIVWKYFQFAKPERILPCMLNGISCKCCMDMKIANSAKCPVHKNLFSLFALDVNS